MNRLIKRAAALLLGWLLSVLGRWDVVDEPSPEMMQEIETWIAHSLEMVINLAVLALTNRSQERPGPGELPAPRDSARPL